MKRFSLHLSLIVLVCLFAAESAQSEQRVITSQTQEPQKTNILVNKDVVEMVKAGLSPDIIIAKIQSSSTNFDTSPAVLADLKSIGVPEPVILAMVQAVIPSTGEGTNASNKQARIKDELTSSFKTASEHSRHSLE